jgi:Uncharacterized protein containing a von Willebrand factor type A (vWA) domain
MKDICCIIDKKTGEQACPLKNVEVKAVINSTMSEVTLTQNYINTGNKNIEAIYTFPMPHNAQVTGFRVKMADGDIEGEFREKDEAYREYDSAVRRGNTAFLLESHRPDIFQISLGNIAAGEAASITIAYIEDMKITDDELRWTLPSVVAPRYIPGKLTGDKSGMGNLAPTDRVPDADYITPPVGEAPYTLKVHAEFKGLHGIRNVSSPSHPIEVSLNNNLVSVELSRETELLDSDFVLIARLEDTSRNSCISAKDKIDGTFADIRFNIDLDDYICKQNNYEYTFMIDISGSMAGEKLEQAKRALRISLRNLMEGDRFNIVAFESNYTSFSKEPVPYSQINLEKADKWITGLDDMGGTEIFVPLQYVLETSNKDHSLERIVLLFTDGQVGNEKEVIRLVERYNQALYLYPFGIDTAVNKFFIDGLAEAGNGIAEYVYPGEAIEDKVIRQFSRIHQPYILNPKLTDEKGNALDTIPVMPKRLYNSEAYAFSFHYEGSDNFDKVLMCGENAGEVIKNPLDVSYDGDIRLLSLKWAKEKIKTIEKQMGSGNGRRDELTRKEIVDLSQKYGILSTMTSLVAIHKRIVRETGMPETTVIPVAKPRGWDMFEEPADVRYCFAAPSKAPSKALASRARYSEVCEDELDVPSFLRKTTSSASRRSKSPRFIESMELKVSEDIGSIQDTAISSVTNGINETIRKASEKQNANGSFGSGKDIINKTSFYIIGMLSMKEDWKPYRIQITKAGDVLIKSGTDNLLLKTIALYMIHEKKLYQGISFQLTLDNQISRLTNQDKEIFDAYKNGNIELLCEHIGEKHLKCNDRIEFARFLLSEL